MKKLLHLNNLEYYAFTGELNDKEKKRIVEKYNRKEIQVLLLSSSGAEGLDLKNTRQIHIMEPHFNMAKINQVIGRGIRYKSHYDLNKKERKVDVYYWISKPDFSNIKKTNKSIKNNNLNNNKKKKTKKNDKIDKKIGVDEYLYKLSRNKEKYIEKFQKYIKKYSIENE
jgi:superfamily II DNA/RNA helicase